MKARLAIALAIVMAVPARAQYHGVIVPAFDGPQPLGQSVATNLYLQVWRTLRKAPFPNPRGLDFGRGIARYSLAVFQPATTQDVTRYTVQNGGVPLVMWGQVENLGDGVLVQAFLAAPEEAAHPNRQELWTIRRGSDSVSLDLPRRTFDFAPVILDRALVEEFQSPNALRMCKTKQRPCDELPVGPDWTADIREGAWAKIRVHPGNSVGYVYLPTLDRLPNDISDFAAALISYDRGDFAQAATLFSRVANRGGSQHSTREDAAALEAIARLRGGQDARAAFQRLERNYPESLYVFQAATMARLVSALDRSGNAQSTALKAIAQDLRANEGLFSPNDAWLAGMKSVLRDS